MRVERCAHTQRGTRCQTSCAYTRTQSTRNQDGGFRMYNLACTVSDAYHSPLSHGCTSLVRTSPVNFSLPERSGSRHPALSSLVCPSTSKSNASPLRTHASHKAHSHKRTPPTPRSLPQPQQSSTASLGFRSRASREQAPPLSPFFFVVCNQDMPLRGPTVSLREGLVGAARKESIGLLSAEVFRGSHALDCTDSWDHAKISLDQQRDVLRP